MTRAMPAATPAKRPVIPSGTASPTSAPRPKPRPAHRMIVATIRLPATTGFAVGGRRRLILERLGVFEIGHGGLDPGGRDVIDEEARALRGPNGPGTVTKIGTL